MKNSNNEPVILADGRWQGNNGIGRFSTEILSRLQHTDILGQGPKPLSGKNLWWQIHQLYKQKNRYKVYFTPGFNPVLFSPLPYVLTICDLIHLKSPGNYSLAKKAFYELFIKPAIKKSEKIITISNHSKENIIEWSGVPEEKVVNVSCGISQVFTHTGKKHTPGYPYLLHVGCSKSHKNITRLLDAFSKAKIDNTIRLILTCTLTPELHLVLKKNKLENRVIFSKILTEEALAAYYRGAIALLFPSLIEGFGLPILEAMASGIPVMTSTTAAIPEVAGDAAIMVDPYDVAAMIDGIEEIVDNAIVRIHLIGKGFNRVKLFSWEKTATQVQQVLDTIL